MKIKKGISLIVLVITIIIMIVLAGTILLTLDNNGVVSKANQAVEKSNLKQVQQLAELAWGEAYADGVRSVEDIGEVKGFETRVLEALEAQNIDIAPYWITVTKNGVEVDKSWVSAIVDEVPIPKGFVASGATGENTKNGGLVIYEGLATVTDANVDEARRTRNQYVWIPVDSDTFDTTFVRNNFGWAYTISNTEGTDHWEALPTTVLSTENSSYMTEETIAEVQAMYKSVKKYGGFYIARYEAGIDEQRRERGVETDLPGIKEGTKVYSVMGKIPYTHIPWTWNGTMIIQSGGAAGIARNMYPYSDTNEIGVVSTLTYGVQWDAAIQWFIDTGAITANQANSTSGSTTFGNYSNHVINTVDELNDGALVWDYSTSSTGSYVAKDSTTLTYPKTSGKQWSLSTGALKAANVNNVYDMAGNLDEWTMEGQSSGERVLRGCSFMYAGSHSISFRDGVSTYYINQCIGFRPSLYIK